MIVACPKCHDEFDVPPADLEGLDPERAVLVTCPVCGACGKLGAFEKEVVRIRKGLAKDARRAKEETRLAEDRAAARDAKQTRRKEEEAPREQEKKGLADRLHERNVQNKADGRLAQQAGPRFSEAAIGKGFRRLTGWADSCIIIGFVGAFVAALGALEMATSGHAEGVVAAILGGGVFTATWRIAGHLLRAVAGIWSAVERTALAAEKNQPAKDSQDSA